MRVLSVVGFCSQLIIISVISVLPVKAEDASQSTQTIIQVGGAEKKFKPVPKNDPHYQTDQTQVQQSVQDNNRRNDQPKYSHKEIHRDEEQSRNRPSIEIHVGSQPQYEIHQQQQYIVPRNLNRPRYFQHMPDGYRAFFINGIHYFFYDEAWFVLSNGYYEPVPAPGGMIIINGEPVFNNAPSVLPIQSFDDEDLPEGVSVFDLNGVRYYYKEGRYYRRDMDGQYLEVPPPN